MATHTARLFKQLRQQRLPPLPSIRDLIKLYQLSALKQLSQNFLLDVKLTSKIAKCAGNMDDFTVCEVGPGPGGITRSILERSPRKVILIEKDKRFEPSLKMLEDACPGKIQIYWGDVLSFDMSKIFPEDCAVPWEDRPKIHLIGNLPFSIATPLIIRWLSDVSTRTNAWSYGRVPMTLTFQKEVAERLTAEENNEQRSRLSIMAQYLTHCSLKFIIRGSAFVPKPDVDVGVVKLSPRVEPLISQPFPIVEKVVRQAFCMKGKYCCRPLSTLFPMSVRQHFTKLLFDAAMVFPNTRPYQLTMDEFSRLCNSYADIIEKYPEVGVYKYRANKADFRWDIFYLHKYDQFRHASNENERFKCYPTSIKPLDVISGDLAVECEREMIAEDLLEEETVFVK